MLAVQRVSGHCAWYPTPNQPSAPNPNQPPPYPLPHSNPTSDSTPMYLVAGAGIPPSPGIESSAARREEGRNEGREAEKHTQLGEAQTDERTERSAPWSLGGAESEGARGEGEGLVWAW